MSLFSLHIFFTGKAFHRFLNVSYFFPAFNYTIGVSFQTFKTFSKEQRTFDGFEAPQNKFSLETENKCGMSTVQLDLKENLYTQK